MLRSWRLLTGSIVFTGWGIDDCRDSNTASSPCSLQRDSKPRAALVNMPSDDTPFHFADCGPRTNSNAENQAATP